MEWIGIAAAVVLLVCLSALIVTSRLDWILAAIWCIPLICIGFLGNGDAELNSFVVLICFFMIYICCVPLFGIKMWNIKSRRKYTTLWVLLFVGNLMVIAYCVVQIKAFHFVYAFLGEYHQGSGIISFFEVVLRVLLVVFIFLLLSVYMTFSVIGFIDRIFSTKESLTIIKCRTMVTNGLIKGYYLEGINNGVTYYFKMTTRMGLLANGEKFMVLSLAKGCFGGMYVLKNPFVKIRYKVKRRDKKFSIRN